jgi:hypothetical protein
MTPFSFEWAWQADYYVFMGLLYLALTIIGSGLAYCFFKTWMDVAGSDENGHDREVIPQRKKYGEY